MSEAESLQIEAGCESVDEADGILLGDGVVEGFGEEGHPIPIAAFHVTHEFSPRGQGTDLDLPYTTPDSSHRLSLKPWKTTRIFD
jgi:hypothetical protein